MLQPQRTVSNHPRYKNGVYYSEKCQRNIQYESGIELAFIKQLEKNKKVRFYYEQPVRIPYRRGRRKATYTPDFAVLLQTNKIVLVEIKDLPGMFDYNVQAKIEVLLNYCHKKGFGLLFTDGKDTIRKVLKVKCNRKFENAVLEAVENRIIRKKECDDIMEKYEVTYNQFLKTTIKHNLKYRNFPFKLQSGNKNQLFRQVFYEKKRYEDLMTERFLTLFNQG